LSQSAVARIRAKSDFLDAHDPERALLEFFGQLSSKFQPQSQQDVAARSRPLILISQLPRSGGSSRRLIFRISALWEDRHK
jgi:hypothetical protein